MATLQLAIDARKARAGASQFVSATKRISTAAILYAGIAVKAFASFETQLANVSTMLDSQTMHYMPRYKAALQNMAIQYGEGTKTLSQGLYNILSASVKADKALSVLNTSVRAGKAGMTDTSTAAYAITGILNAYGLEAEKAGVISDILFATVKSGQTTFGKLAPTIGRVTAISSDAGIALEEVSAALSTITRGGISTEEAITGLRQAIIALQGNEEGAIKTARAHNIELSTQALQRKGLIGLLKELSTLSPEIRKDIFGEVRARTALSTLLKDQTGFLRDYNRALDSSGSTMEAFTKMADTTETDMNRLWQAIKVTSAEVGEGLAPAVRYFTELLIENRAAIKRWAEDVVEGVDVAVDALKVLSPAYFLYSGTKALGRMEDEKADARALEKAIQQRYRAETGETEAFTYKPGGTTMRPGAMGATTNMVRVEPKDRALYEQLLRDARQEAASYEAFRQKWSKEIHNVPVPVQDQGPTLPTTTAAGTDGAAAPTAFAEKRERDRAAALKRVNDMHRALSEEQQIIGMTSESRERGLDIIRLENEARAAGIENITAEVAQYKAAIRELRKAEQLRSIADNMGTAFGRAFEDITFGAQTAGEAIRSLAMDIARLVMQQTITQPLANVISDFAYNAFRPNTQPSMSSAGAGGYHQAAFGSAFNRGQVVPFAGGGVVDDLTYFPMAGGRTGLMGEVGPEAVMPLRRGANGRLGVEVAGSSRDSETKITIEVQNQTAAPIKAESGGVRFDGEKMVVGIILKDLSEYGPVRRAMMNMNRG